MLPIAVSPAPISEAREPAPVAPADSPDEVAELLDDFLIAMLDLAGGSDTAPTLWTDVALALPDELFDRLDQYLEARLS